MLIFETTQGLAEELALQPTVDAGETAPTPEDILEQISDDGEGSALAEAIMIWMEGGPTPVDLYIALSNEGYDVEALQAYYWNLSFDLFDEDNHP